VTRTSIFSASIGDGEAGPAPASGFVTYSVCSVAWSRWQGGTHQLTWPVEIEISSMRGARNSPAISIAVGRCVARLVVDDLETPVTDSSAASLQLVDRQVLQATTSCGGCRARRCCRCTLSGWKSILP
jgi:hypothetical protein